MQRTGEGFAAVCDVFTFGASCQPAADLAEGQLGPAVHTKLSNCRAGQCARMFDERFLAHRQRSTSIAGIVSTAAAILLFEYRYFVDPVANWDLAAIGVLLVVVKNVADGVVRRER